MSIQSLTNINIVERPFHTEATLKKSLLAWKTVAILKGMSSKEVKTQNCFIVKQMLTILHDWPPKNKSIYFKRNEVLDGPSRAVEFFIKDSEITVVTHCKKKGGLKALGVGHHSIVKTSIVSLSLNVFSNVPSNTKPGTIIADKVPKKENLSENTKESFIRESEITSKFDQAINVRRLMAGVKDRVDKSGILLYGMEVTLKQVFDKSFGFNIIEKLTIAKDLLNGIIEMQSKNVVHRDLHMANCARDYSGRWMIHDMGLALNKGQEILPGSTVNVFVLSPSKVRVKIFNETSTADFGDDLWALGIMLFEIDHHTPPKFMKTIEEIWKALNNGDSVEIQTAYKKYVPEVEEFFHDLQTPSSNPNYVLRQVVLDILNGKCPKECYDNVKVRLDALHVEHDENKKPPTKLTDCSEEFELEVKDVVMGGYQTKLQLEKLFSLGNNQ